MDRGFAFVLLSTLPMVTIAVVRLQLDEPQEPVVSQEPVEPVGCGLQASKYQPKLFARKKLTRIIGGDKADAHTWPWEVILQVQDIKSASRTYQCVANLVRANNNTEKSDILLTAAQCVADPMTMDDLDPVPIDTTTASRYKIIVAIGAHNIKERGPEQRNIRIAEVRLHPRFSEGTHNDVALIRLADPITFGETIRPVCLPAQGEAPPVGKECAFAGWGETEGDSTSDVLKEAAFPVHNATTCSQRWRQVEDGYFVDDEHICAGPMDASSVSGQGDAGGMLACKDDDHYTLYGVLSFGLGKPGFPDGFSRVSSYMDWIDPQIKDMTLVK